MDRLNHTAIAEFILLGLTDVPELQILLFFTFLLFYLFNILGNASIFALIILDHSLHKPMYFFLANLAFLDFFYSTTTVPKMLSGLLIGDKRISIIGCNAQLHFYHFLGSTEALLLTSMSYDRYVAICNPLQYHLIMARTACIQLAISCWLIGFFYSLSQTIITFRLPYCNIKQVRHFYCDIKPVLKLACADTHLDELITSIIFALVAVSTFTLIIISYMFIGRHVLNIRSSRDRRKVFSTCTSHLTVVFLYIGTALMTYLGPSTDNSLEQDRMSAILVTVITPALNPLIYTLRNAEVNQSIKKIFFRNQNFRLH
ncbi:olfactory receptor 12D1-like [Aquarana catesbeiana]|uniref:olfactory receptor 12D1-like n=1 Tax=Aquarana catesbeiana TaxID=8400 RepID=UPI003CCA2B9C